MKEWERNPYRRLVNQWSQVSKKSFRVIELTNILRSHLIYRFSFPKKEKKSPGDSNKQALVSTQNVYKALVT